MGPTGTRPRVRAGAGARRRRRGRAPRAARLAGGRRGPRGPRRADWLRRRAQRRRQWPSHVRRTRPRPWPDPGRGRRRNAPAAAPPGRRGGRRPQRCGGAGRLALDRIGSRPSGVGGPAGADPDERLRRLPDRADRRGDARRAGRDGSPARRASDAGRAAPARARAVVRGRRARLHHRRVRERGAALDQLPRGAGVRRGRRRAVRTADRTAPAGRPEGGTRVNVEALRGTANTLLTHRA